MAYGTNEKPVDFNPRLYDHPTTNISTIIKVAGNPRIKDKAKAAMPAVIEAFLTSLTETSPRAVGLSCRSTLLSLS
jgi:histone H3/H4